MRSVTGMTVERVAAFRNTPFNVGEYYAVEGVTQWGDLFILGRIWDRQFFEEVS